MPGDAAPPGDHVFVGQYGNMLGSLILRMRDSGAFLHRHHAISLGAVLYLIDVFLLVIEPGGFPFVQLTAHNSLIDPSFPVSLPLINPRRLHPGNGHPAHTRRHSANREQHRPHRCPHRMKGLLS